MLYGTGLSADITSCVTEAENCMSLLLTYDMFNLATDWHQAGSGASVIDQHQAGHGDGIDNAAHVSDSHDCDERLEMNEELDVVIDRNSHPQCEHADVDCEVGLSAASINDGNLADMESGSDKSTTLSTAAIDTGHDTEPNIADESCKRDIHREHGVHSFRYALHIDIASHVRVEQTEDNADVVRTLQELTTLLVNRYSPTVKRWLEVNIHC